MPTNPEVSILLVEDDEVDVKAVQRAFKKHKIASTVVVAKDGIEGWAALQNMKRPFLILLDVNLPRMSGLELLRMIRHDENFHDTVVFVLTASAEEKHKSEAYNLNVAGFLQKSKAGTGFIRAIEMIEQYCKVNEFPGHD